MKNDNKVKGSTLTESKNAADPTGPAIQGNKLDEDPPPVTNNNTPPPAQKDGEVEANKHNMGNKKASSKWQLGWRSEVDWRRNELPKGWTAEKDIQEFEARFGKPQGICYFDDVRNRIEWNLDNLRKVLESGLRYFDATQHPAHIPDAAAELERLLRIGLNAQAYSGDPLSPDYVKRASDAFRYLRLRWVEYETIMLEYNGSDTGWLYPLVALSDDLGSAALNLHEFLSCEHWDFDKRTGELDWLC